MLSVGSSVTSESADFSGHTQTSTADPCSALKSQDARAWIWSAKCLRLGSLQGDIDQRTRPYPSKAGWPHTGPEWIASRCVVTGPRSMLAGASPLNKRLRTSISTIPKTIAAVKILLAPGLDLGAESTLMERSVRQTCSVRPAALRRESCTRNDAWVPFRSSTQP
jgi:hypothetical protein